MGYIDVKTLFTFFNTLIWLSGGVLLGVGIWIVAGGKLGDTLDVLYVVTNDVEIRNLAVFDIGFGALVFVVACLGCYGAIRSIKDMLLVYIILVGFIILVELATGIFATLNRDKVTDGLNKDVVIFVKERYQDHTERFGKVQKEFECCGANDGHDYINSTWHRLNSSENIIPESCCSLNDQGKPKDLQHCQDKKKGFYHPKGCTNVFKAWYKAQSELFIRGAVGVAALQIGSFIVAIFLLRNLIKFDTGAYKFKLDTGIYRFIARRSSHSV